MFDILAYRRSCVGCNVRQRHIPHGGMKKCKGKEDKGTAKRASNFLFVYALFLFEKNEKKPQMTHIIAKRNVFVSSPFSISRFSYNTGLIDDESQFAVVDNMNVCVITDFVLVSLVRRSNWKLVDEEIQMGDE